MCVSMVSMVSWWVYTMFTQPAEVPPRTSGSGIERIVVRQENGGLGAWSWCFRLGFGEGKLIHDLYSRGNFNREWP